MPLWTINGRFASQPITGVQRYAGQIVQALDRQLAQGRAPAGLDIEMLVPPGTQVPFALAQIRVRTVGHRHGHAWEQTELPRFVQDGLLSLANTGPLLAPSHIVCIHDANTRICPESYAFLFRALYRVLHPALGHTASRVATVSRYSAEQLARLRIAPAGKIFVASNGHEHARSWMPRHTGTTKRVAGPHTIVVLGSGAPHKNIAMLLSLAPRLAAAGFRLAITGMTDSSVFASSAQSSAVADTNVHWMGRLDDEALAALLRDSLCLAFPSLTEGFGLPPLEAMTLGCPVVVSDCASLPEICGRAALFAPPNDPDAWLAHFERLRGDPSLRGRMIERGRVQATEFSWDRSATLYLEAMRELAVTSVARRSSEPRLRAPARSPL